MPVELPEIMHDAAACSKKRTGMAFGGKVSFPLNTKWGYLFAGGGCHSTTRHRTDINQLELDYAVDYGFSEIFANR